MTAWHVETVAAPVADLLLPPVAGDEARGDRGGVDLCRYSDTNPSQGPAAAGGPGDQAGGPGRAEPVVRGVRVVLVVQPVDRALVLGSTQPLAHVDQMRAEAARTAVLRRRSGGGAVLVAPDAVVWVDVALPAGDDLAERDVGRAFWWLGEVWAAALAAVGLGGAEVWHGGLVRSAWSDRVCFAGLGAGEVTVGGAKVVGMAQRRSRAGALFQCAVPVTWDPGALLDLLALDDEARARGAAELAGAARGVGAGVAGPLVREFLDRLP